MKDFLALMNPTRWAVLAGVVLALVAALAGLGTSVHANGRDAGRAEVRAEWDAQREQAQAKQDEKTDAADQVLVQEVEVIRTVYRDRTKEVIRYAPAPDTHCPADPDFVRLFNGTATR